MKPHQSSYNSARHLVLKTSKVKHVDEVSVVNFYGRYKEPLKMELLNNPAGLVKTIREPAINRPGLAIADFFSYFADKRVQVFGSAELAYLEQLDEETLKKRIGRMLAHDVPCLVFSPGTAVPKAIIQLADAAGVCVFGTRLVTMKFVNMATILLETEFAESTSTHGCMLDVRGVGILIRGISGIGKSEAALALVERGAALVADDMVQLRNINGEVNATSPTISRGFLEVRGLGIVNVTNIFGLKAIRQTKMVDLVVTLSPSSELTNIDRLGLEREMIEVLGEKIVHIELSVAPGRDIARLIEVAAIDYMLKSMGYDMANEFNRRLMNQIKMSPEKNTGE